MTQQLELRPIEPVKPIDVWVPCTRPSCNNWAEWGVLHESGLFFIPWCNSHLPKGKR